MIKLSLDEWTWIQTAVIICLIHSDGEFQEIIDQRLLPKLKIIISELEKTESRVES